MFELIILQNYAFNFFYFNVAIFRAYKVLNYVWIFETRLDVYYFGCDLLECCPHLYCGQLKQCFSRYILRLPQVSLVYVSIEMIQPGKSFLKFDCSPNKAFKNYEDLFQIMTSLFFMPIKLKSILRRVMRWIQNLKFNRINYSWYFF